MNTSNFFVIFPIFPDFSLAFPNFQPYLPGDKYALCQTTFRPLVYSYKIDSNRGSSRRIRTESEMKSRGWNNNKSAVRWLLSSYYVFFCFFLNLFAFLSIKYTKTPICRFAASMHLAVFRRVRGYEMNPEGNTGDRLRETDMFPDNEQLQVMTDHGCDWKLQLQDIWVIKVAVAEQFNHTLAHVVRATRSDTSRDSGDTALVITPTYPNPLFVPIQPPASHSPRDRV